MTKGIYSVRDMLLGFYDPYTLPNDLVALRSFASAVLSDSPNVCNENVTDVSLWKIGELDTISGEITPCQVQLITAMEVVSKKKGDEYDLPNEN